ncbi:hypothetical protein [Frankia sp. CiP3]|uniref:hypothetical protein n=1 Tax=Frankia sp. CiP3 TaxID=2880971 RepID=UPI001EF3DA92|nr:hypothetical protein [Frankia sp. CiP3]
MSEKMCASCGTLIPDKNDQYCSRECGRAGRGGSAPVAYLDFLEKENDKNDVIAMLVQLSKKSGWQRLEASIDKDGKIGGYCMLPLSGEKINTAAARRNGKYPNVIGPLVNLLIRSGWKRLEILREPGHAPGGFCEQADGSPVYILATHLQP